MHEYVVMTDNGEFIVSANSMEGAKAKVLRITFYRANITGIYRK